MKTKAKKFSMWLPDSFRMAIEKLKEKNQSIADFIKEAIKEKLVKEASNGKHRK